MKLITRYVLGELALYTFFTLLALLGLFAFFDIVKEVPDLGQGNYTLWVMLAYVGLLMPGHAYELMPLAVLIGALVAMSQLAMSSEYTVIRTSGVSLRQVGGILFLFGLIFALVTMLLGELVAPAAEQQAERMRLGAMRSMVAQEFQSGIWVKDNRNFINVGEMLPDNTLLKVRIYTYDQDYRLVTTRYADRGVYNGERKLWQLENVRESRLFRDHVESQVYPRLDWNSVVEPRILDVLLVVPEQMSAASLVRYIEHLSANKQKTSRYEIALWGKVFYPLACVSMALVALAFTPRQRRQGQLGLRVFGGICLGVGFHFINRLFGHLGLLYDWNAVLAATVPTLLFLVAGVALIRLQEKH